LFSLINKKLQPQKNVLGYVTIEEKILSIIKNVILEKNAPVKYKIT